MSEGEREKGMWCNKRWNAAGGWGYRKKPRDDRLGTRGRKLSPASASSPLALFDSPLSESSNPESSPESVLCFGAVQSDREQNEVLKANEHDMQVFAPYLQGP